MQNQKAAQVLCAADLLPTEKLVGFIILHHVNSKTGKTRLKQSTIAEEAGVSIRTVKRAISALQDAALLDSLTTGRSAVFSFLPVKVLSNVEGPLVAHQIGHGCPLKPTKKPWQYDTEFSSIPEEEHKRYESKGGENGTGLR